MAIPAMQGDVGPLKHALKDSSMAVELWGVSPPCSLHLVLVVHARAHLCYLLSSAPAQVVFGIESFEGAGRGAGREVMAWE